RTSVKVNYGDRLLVVTDGVLETPNARGEQFGTERVEGVLQEHRDESIGALAERVLDALRLHAGTDGLAHDDVTFLLVEFVEGPTFGEHLWLAIRNRVLPKANELP